MSEVIPFRPRSARSLPAITWRARAADAGPRDYRLADIARLLGVSAEDRRFQIALLRKLHRLEAMPLPKSPRIRGDHVLTGADSIHARSVWDADVFDAWLHRPDPSACGMAALPPVPADARARMRRTAAALCAGEQA